MTELLVFWLLIALAAAISTYNANVWHDPISMWSRASWSTSGDSSRAFGELGAYSKLKGDNGAAKTYLMESIRLNPKFGPAMNNYAWILFQDGQREDAWEQMRVCQERCPDYAQGWHDFGLMSENLGKADLAAECYRKALAIEPQQNKSLNRLGLVAFHRRDFGEAVASFEQLVERVPNQIEYTYNRAVTWKHMGKVKEGQNELARLPQPCPITGDMIPVEFAR